MNRVFRITGFILTLILAACAGESAIKVTEAPTAHQPPSTQVQPVSPSSSLIQSVTPFWTGDGGTGKSIAILPPKVTGFAENQSYLSDLVQGEFVANFSRFSAISVLDRVSLEKQYAELLSGYYDDEAGMDLGHLPPTDYFMSGSITKTATGYTLQMRIAKNADKMIAASYSGTCAPDELDNLSGIRRASFELLQGLGVKPTAIAKTELAEAAAGKHINAQTALAKGISAQRQGTEVEALTYYFQAAALDSSLLEAANRSAIMSANISSGNIGNDTRNDIAWRRDWMARLTETEEYFADLFNTNTVPYTLFYSTEIIPGDVNYRAETQNLSIWTKLRPTGAWTWLTSVERALRAVYDGLNATKRKEVWGLYWPGTSVTDLKPFERKSRDFSITIELVNSNNKVIGRTNFQSSGSWNFNMSYGSPTISVSGDDRKQVRFDNVKADDITDSLTIRVATVNGIDAQTAARTGVLQVKAISKEDWNQYISFNLNRNVITGYSGGSSLRIPGSIWDEPVVIGDGAFRNNQFTDIINIPDNTTIENGAFQSNKFTHIIIGNNVTIGENAFTNNQFDWVRFGRSVIIGKRAFRNNQFDIINIPDNTTIGNGAFQSNHITHITIGNNVTIGENAFADNRNITRIIAQKTIVTIGNNVNIGSRAFGNNDIIEITIGANNTIAYNAFDFHFQDDDFYNSRFADFYNKRGRKAGRYKLLRYGYNTLFGAHVLWGIDNIASDLLGNLLDPFL